MNIVKTIFIKPAHPDLIVRDPMTKQPLPVEGKEVTDNTYWCRRLRDGDVVKAKPPKKTAGSTTNSNKE